MTLEETKTMLIMIIGAYPNAKQSKDSVLIWHDVFKTKPVDVVMAALKEHISTNQWEPKISELLSAVDKKTLPPSLLMTASEAFAQPKNTRMLLVNEARLFAAKAVPFTGGQFDSPEALATATRIHDARLEKEFKQRFETLQNQAKAKIHLGMDPKEAIITTCPEASKRIEGPVGLKVARLVSGLGNPKVTTLVSDLSDTMGKKKKIN